MKRITGEQKKIVAARLAELARTNGGRLTPDAVVDDARNKRSPLHTLFQWDDRTAAHQHRLDQARALITSVEYIIKTEKYVIECPVYVRDPSCAGHEQGYVAIDSVRSNEDEARAVLLDEFQRVAGMLRRAREIAKALELDAEVGQLLAGVVDLRGRIERDGDSATVQ